MISHMRFQVGYPTLTLALNVSHRAVPAGFDGVAPQPPQALCMHKPSALCMHNGRSPAEGPRRPRLGAAAGGFPWPTELRR
jgi:hypothetical protein